MTVKDAAAAFVALAPALMSVPVVGSAVGAVLSSEPAIVAFSGLMAVNAGASGYNAYQAARADDWQTFTSEAGNVVLSSVFAGGGFRSLRAPRLPGLYTGEYTTSRYGDIRIKVPVRTPNPALTSKSYGGLTIRAAEKAAAVQAGRKAAKGITNWKGDPVTISEGHVMSPRDLPMSARPQVEVGPFTPAQRAQFLRGNSAGTNLAPHHRHQIPIRYGGVIDEIPGPGHPFGNMHTAGSPTRHPSPSIFNSMEGGNSLRQAEIRAHWKAKGNRLVEIEPGVWVDPGL